LPNYERSNEENILRPYAQGGYSIYKGAQAESKRFFAVASENRGNNIKPFFSKRFLQLHSAEFTLYPVLKILKLPYFLTTI
jgi:hypothetical protein